MHFEPGEIYHVYNRGNNRVKIFFLPKNYLFLLKKVENEWLDYCHLFCYCLMPNHFHFMIQAKDEGCEYLILKSRMAHLQLLSKAIGKTLSSYTQAINIQNKTVGNLFQKKTKSKCLTDISLLANSYQTQSYLWNCFFYIHNNPIEAGITKDLSKWPYSSWPDYYGFRKESLCNKDLAIKRIGLSLLDLNPTKEWELNGEIIENIW